MPKYKLLVLDLDNTTLDDNKRISDKNRLAIQKCIKEGIYVMVASGRPPVLLKEILEDIGLYDCWNVAINGVIIFKGSEESETISSISNKSFKKILKEYRKRNSQIATVFDNNKVLSENPIGNAEYMKGFASDINNVHKANFDDISSPQKFIVYTENKEDELFWRDFAEKENLQTCYAEHNWLEIMPKGINKYTGVLKVAEKLKIKKEEIAAIGDQENDIPIIENAALGVAVKNAQEALKEKADVVLDKTNNEDAIYHLAKDYLL